MAYPRQEIVTILRRTGYTDLADEAERTLPDPVDLDELTAFTRAHGVN